MGQASLRVRARGLGRDLLSWVALSVWLLSAGPGATPQNPNPPEVQAHEGQSQVVKPSFQLRVERNLVTVRVVVRDGKDRPVGSLRQEDFRLFDDGKAQTFWDSRSRPASPTRPRKLCLRRRRAKPPRSHALLRKPSRSVLSLSSLTITTWRRKESTELVMPRGATSRRRSGRKTGWRSSPRPARTRSISPRTGRNSMTRCSSWRLDRTLRWVAHRSRSIRPT